MDLQCLVSFDMENAHKNQNYKYYRYVLSTKFNLFYAHVTYSFHCMDPILLFRNSHWILFKKKKQKCCVWRTLESLSMIMVLSLLLSSLISFFLSFLLGFLYFMDFLFRLKFMVQWNPIEENRFWWEKALSWYGMKLTKSRAIKYDIHQILHQNITNH